MSHHTIYRTMLTGITQDFLRSTIQSLAEQLGAQVRTHVQDYYGDWTKVPIALKTKDLPMGIGFSVGKEGSLRIEGDEFGYRDEFQRISTVAESYLKACMAIQKARQLNPTAQAQTKIVGKQVVLELVW